MTCSATPLHNTGEAWAGVDRKTLASKRHERGRPGLCALRAAERSMSAFGRGKRRCLLLARALGAAAAALAASFAWAGAPAAEPNRGGAIRLLSPEAPASFGAMGDVSPLIAAFNAARARQDDAPRLML